MIKREVELSARMRALTRLVTPGGTVCDIGCDHGFVSIYLVQKDIAKKVYAMDVRSGPLSHAREHIQHYGLESQIETRLSDGLQKLAVGEADTMICAGMGGPLMIRILQEGREKAMAMKELILQPQSELEEFRMFLRTNGYHIIKEDMVFEDGKYYPMMKVMPKGCAATNAEDRTEQDVCSIQQLADRFGPCLLKQRHPVLKQYLEHYESVTIELIDRLKAQDGERAKNRLPELEQDLALIRQALTNYH